MTLGDIADFINGDRSSNYPSGSDFVVNGIPFINAGDIDDGGVNFKNGKQISREAYERLRAGKTISGDVLFCLRGSLGKLTRYCEDFEAAIASSLVIIRARKTTDPLFLYYLLKGPSVQSLMTALDNGSAQPNLSVRELSRIAVPPLTVTEQKAVASVLGALDDKIELNRKMSATLEAIARALFKSWFVDFDPVRAKTEGRNPGLPAEIAALFPDSFEETAYGQIPSGWLTKCVADVATASRATINPGNVPDEFFEHYSIPAYDAGRGAIVERGEAIKSNKFVVLHDAVLLSRLNPSTPRIWMPTSIGPHRAICSTEFAVMLPKAHTSREWLYCLFSNQTFCDHLTTMVTGTSGSHQRVRPESLLAMQTVAPAEQVVQIFTKIVRPFLTRVALARNESLTLVGLRDTLLPKLISGELRVGEADRVLAASA